MAKKGRLVQVARERSLLATKEKSDQTLLAKSLRQKQKKDRSQAGKKEFHATRRGLSPLLKKKFRLSLPQNSLSHKILP
jgi:hypothetical protein